MTDLHSNCDRKLTLILEAFSDAAAMAKVAVDQANEVLECTPDAEPRTVDQLLEDALSSEKQLVLKAQDHASRVKGSWKRILDFGRAKRGVEKAEAVLRSRYELETRSAAAQGRIADSNGRTAKRNAHRACKQDLRKAETALVLRQQQHKELRNLCRPLCRAIVSKAWIAGNTEVLLDESARYVQAHDWASAVEAIQRIEFQRLPSREQVLEWIHECSDKLKTMMDQSAGLVATAAYPGLLDASLKLAKSRFHADVWDTHIECYEDLPDRWYALPVTMIGHHVLFEPIQWVIYWAFLTRSQSVAISTGQVKVHEDSLTGMLTYALKEELEGTAKARFLQLGYPRAKVNFDFLQLAGLDGEFETGADIGLVIHLDVGDLLVHKVALLQAKISKRGSAEVGSKASGSRKLTQLQKLQDSERDFFLFYHKTIDASPALLPTVTAVSHFANKHKWTTADLLKEKKSVKTREHGWDLASFVAFGLCSPTNAIGRDIPVGDDPLDAMAVSGRETLPTYIMVVSLSHDESAYRNVMTPLIEKGYRSVPDPVDENALSRSPDEHDRPAP